MCGIAGKISLKKTPVEKEHLVLMTDKISHRGPDDEGIYISEDKKVGLGNRRLAIIDLSKKGHQPMNYLGRYWITTNGEIYNFKEEREKLIKDGYEFSSDCDTEVILALYDKYKEDCLSHLRGMFAFCIYDSKENIIFLARDRLGVKPLKYYFDSETLIFASEAKAILTQQEVSKKIDREAILEYLIYGYIPSPKTGFEKIYKLEPGHYIKLNLKSRSFKKVLYWSPPFNKKWELSEKEWCHKILDELEESTKLRMISDVPVGAFLSGGVDSSGVVAMMATLSKKPINTFTITFKEKSWNESEFAKKVAKKFKTNHREISAKEIDLDLIKEASYYYEEPYADAGAIVSFMVNRLAKKYVTVILNGDGGDENFAGYPNRHFRIKRDVELESLLKFVNKGSAIFKSVDKITGNPHLKKTSQFLEKSKLPLYERYLTYNQVFSLENVRSITTEHYNRLFNKTELLRAVRDSFNDFEGPDKKDAALKFEMQYWLPDDLLAKADLMSMANGIEGRSPFLDYKLVELAGKIPFDLKVKNKEPKYILKKALEKLIPKENLYREKRGFGIPLHLWFSGKLKDYARNVLLNKRSKISEIIQVLEIEKMIDNHRETNDFGPRLWSLLTLELWLQYYFN